MALNWTLLSGIEAYVLLVCRWPTCQTVKLRNVYFSVNSGHIVLTMVYGIIHAAHVSVADYMDTILGWQTEFSNIYVITGVQAVLATKVSSSVQGCKPRVSKTSSYSQYILASRLICTTKHTTTATASCKLQPVACRGRGHSFNVKIATLSIYPRRIHRYPHDQELQPSRCFASH